jgi:hypothetical protein
MYWAIVFICNLRPGSAALFEDLYPSCGPVIPSPSRLSCFHFASWSMIPAAEEELLFEMGCRTRRIPLARVATGHHGK